MPQRFLPYPFLFALLVGAGPASAQDGLQRCARIAADAERLACFDALAAAVAPATDVAAPAAAATAPVPAAPIAAEFGREHIAPARDDETAVQELRLTVASARHTDLTGWTIEFDNGQVWKQIGTERFNVEVGSSYLVKRGVMNSFQLQDEQSGRRIRVRREK